jgi:hypothetical protein
MITTLSGLIHPRDETVRKPVELASSVATSVYLPLAPPALGSQGVVIGRELYSGKAFVYCPFALFGDGLPGPNKILLGDTGRGKSAEAKTYALRQALLGRQIAVLDTKEQSDRGEGEWAAVGRAVSGREPVRIVPGGAGARINPLDPAISGARQHELLRTLIELGLRRGLSELEGNALRLAHARVARHAADTGAPALLPDVAAALREPDERDATAKARTREQLLDDGLEVSYVIDRLTDVGGDLTGMLDGPTSIDVDLDASMVVFDLSRVPSSSVAMPILVAVLGVWLEEVWLRPICDCGAPASEHGHTVLDTGSGAWERGGCLYTGCRRYSQRKRILICEEAWHILGNAFMAALFEKFLKFARSLGLQFVAIVHHLSDIDDNAYTAATLQMADTITVYAMAPAQAQAVVDRLHLPRWTAEVIPTLTRGVGLWSVAGRLYTVQHLLTDAEADLVFTNTAMRDGTPTELGLWE